MALKATLAVAALAAAVTAAVAVPAANAGLLDPITNVVLPTCGTNVQPFAEFGDTSSYFGFADNGFESGTGGWSLGGGAYVGSGNEPWYVNGWGSRSLVLPPGASATSPSFCINLLDPAIRMFASSAAGADLHVQVLFYGLTGDLTGILNAADVQGTGSWAPTQRVSSSLALPLLTSYARIRLTAGTGTWRVDDAYIDPCISMIG